MRLPRIEWRDGKFYDLDERYEVVPSEVAAGYNRLTTDTARSEGDHPPERRLCLPCVRCGAEPQPIFPETAQDGARANPNPPRAQPSGAVTFRGQPAYGSEFDQPLPLEINVCDACLRTVASSGRVNMVREVRSTKTSHFRWVPRA